MHVIVDIAIAADEYLKHYQASGTNVSTRSRDGRSVRFPSSILQPYLLHDGINGSFRISFDDSGKFKAIDRL